MKASITGYRNFPGEHCGSSSMRGLLHHYCGLELPEEAVFGLASGLASIYLTGPGLDPAHLLFGRGISIEADLADNLQVDYREQTEDDDDVAWHVVREEVLEGRPTMLSGDILYLDYREYKVHFPGHRFVMLGFDDETEKVEIADRINVEPELCSYGALRTSRNPPEGMSTHNLWGRFHGTEVGRSLRDASRAALDRCRNAMLADAPALADESLSAFAIVSGVSATRRFSESIPSWAARDDAAWAASYNSRCIEKFGNGGGNFRRLYAGFLDWAHGLDPALCPASAGDEMRAIADEWTALSETLRAASQNPADSDPWHRARDQGLAIAAHEESLLQAL